MVELLVEMKEALERLDVNQCRYGFSPFGNEDSPSWVLDFVQQPPKRCRNVVTETFMIIKILGLKWFSPLYGLNRRRPSDALTRRRSVRRNTFQRGNHKGRSDAQAARRVSRAS